MNLHERAGIEFVERGNPPAPRCTCPHNLSGDVLGRFRSSKIKLAERAIQTHHDMATHRLRAINLRISKQGRIKPGKRSSTTDGHGWTRITSLCKQTATRLEGEGN